MRKKRVIISSVLLSLSLSLNCFAADLSPSGNEIIIEDMPVSEQTAEDSFSSDPSISPEPEADSSDTDVFQKKDIDTAEDICNPALNGEYDFDDTLPSPAAEDLNSLIPADKKLPAGFTPDMWKELRLINTQRHKAGAEPLAGFEELQKIAAVRTKEIKKKFSHARPDGSDCFSAYTIDYRAAGENIAMGYANVSDVMNGWMDSPCHKSNILDSVFTHVGIGVIDRNYVQNFATPWDSSNCSIYVLGNQRIIKKKGKISKLGIVVMVKDGYGYSYLPLEDYMCSDYNAAVEGIYNVTVTVRGSTTTFPLIVSSNGKNITIDNLPEIDPEKDECTAVMVTGQILSPGSYLNPSCNAAKYSLTSGKKYITLSKKGQIKAKKAGYAVVTVYEKENYIYRAASRYLIKVVNPKFTKKSISLTVGSEDNIMDYMSGSEEIKPSSFTSSKQTVATVDPETGVVTGIKKGSAKITALYNNGEKTVKRTITVKVKK